MKIIDTRVLPVHGSGAGVGQDTGVSIVTRTRPERYPYPQPMRVTQTHALAYRALMKSSSRMHYQAQIYKYWESKAK